MAHIIHQRIDEIFDLVQQEIVKAGFPGRLSAGLVITGGASEIQGALELASDVFGVGVRHGSPAESVSGLSDAVESARFSTVVGLAQYGAHRLALGASGSASKRMKVTTPGMDRIAQRVKLWLQDFF
jgi:cell division protein FtsA